MDGDTETDSAEAKLQGGSEPVPEFFCEECREEGDQREADWFCNDCEEYLCVDCATIHRKTRLTRHHALLDKDNTPRRTVPTTPKLSHDSCTDVCPEHRAEIIKYFCDDHDSFACGVCTTIKHRNCEGISYIPQVAEELETSEDYVAMVTELQVINQQYKQLHQDAETNSSKVETYGNNAVKSVREIKDQIYNIFELLEHCVQEETEQTKARDMEKITSLISKSQCGLEKSQKILMKINELQESKRLCRLFGFMKEIKRQVGALRSDLEHTTELNTIKHYEFKATSKIKEILRSPSGIGHIVYHETDTDQDDLSQRNKASPQKLDCVDDVKQVLMDNDVTDSQTLQDSEKSDKTEQRIEVVGTCSKNSEKSDDIDRVGKLQELEIKDTTDAVSKDGKCTKTKKNIETDLSHKDGQHKITDCDTIAQEKCKDVPSDQLNTIQIESVSDSHEENVPRHETYTLTVHEDTDKEGTASGETTRQQHQNTEPADSATGPAGVTAGYLAELKIKSKDDSMTPYISGLTLMLSNVLLLCDFNNSKVKVFDTTLGILVNDLQFEHGPWDIIETYNDQVAVTIPYMNKIYQIKIEPTLVLTKVKEIKVKGNCRGITYKTDRLFVSFTSPPKIEVIDLGGTIVATILGESQAANTLSLPYHVIINHDDDIIYVSNSNGNDVISLTLSGEINAACQDLKYPRGMCFDSRGFIYVCARDSHVIHVITPECRKVKTLLNQNNGLRLPMSMYVNQKSKQMYVGMEDDFLKVYQLT